MVRLHGLEPHPRRVAQGIAQGVRGVNLITIQSAAERLAISERQVYRLIADGRLAVVNLGARCYRIRPEDLDRMVRTSTHLIDPCPSTGTKPRRAGASNSRPTAVELENLLRPAPARPKRNTGKPRLEIVHGKAS